MRKSGDVDARGNQYIQLISAPLKPGDSFQGSGFRRASDVMCCLGDRAAHRAAHQGAKKTRMTN